MCASRERGSACTKVLFGGEGTRQAELSQLNRTALPPRGTARSLRLKSSRSGSLSSDEYEGTARRQQK